MRPVTTPAVALAALAALCTMSASVDATTGTLGSVRAVSAGVEDVALSTDERDLWISAGSEAFGTQYFNSLDNATTFTGVSSGSSPTAGQGNLQTGMAVNLANFTPGVSQIRFLEVPIANLSGAAITGRPVRLNVWMWRTVDTATLATSTTTTTTPVFSNIVNLGGGPTAPTTTFTFPSVTLASGSFAIASLDFGTPFTITPTAGNLIGIAFNIQVNNGAGFVNIPGVNTTVIGGVTQAAPLVGSNLFSSATGGYFRSANSTVDINGQFAAGSVRNIGNNSGVPFALFIPEPATLSVLGAAAVTMLRRRK